MSKDATTDVCRDCGCVIGDKQKHSRFHRDLEGPARIRWVPGSSQPEPPDSYPPPTEPKG